MNLGSGAHPTSYPMGSRGSSPGGGRAVKQTTYLYLVPRSRMRGAIHLLPQNAFMVWCLVKHRGNFTFILFYCVGSGGSAPNGKVEQNVKLTIQISTVTIFRMYGALPPVLSLTHGTTGKNFTLLFRRETKCLCIR
jgi:hypothetical protein